MFCSLTSSHPRIPQGCTSPDAELSVSPPGLWHLRAGGLQKCCAHVRWSSAHVRFPQPSAKQICSALGWAVQGWCTGGGCTRGGHPSGTSTSVAYTIHTILSISLISPTLVPNHPTSLCSYLFWYPGPFPTTPFAIGRFRNEPGWALAQSLKLCFFIWQLPQVPEIQYLQWKNVV